MLKQYLIEYGVFQEQNTMKKETFVAKDEESVIYVVRNRFWKEFGYRSDFWMEIISSKEVK